MNILDGTLHFHKTHRVLSHLLFWIAVLLIATAGDSYQYRERFFSYNTVTYYLLTLSTQILTAYFLAYFIIPRFFNTKKYYSLTVYFVVGLYLIYALSRIINIFVREPLVGLAPKDFETVGEILTNVLKLFYVYFFQNLSVAVVFLFLKLLIGQYNIQKHALALEKQKAEAELKLLKTQLNPHFLFNTLNNIYSLSLVHSPATSASIARLADILDHMLYRCNEVLVPLAGEVTLLNNYIGLEKLRYDERLQVNFTTNIDHEILIAPLILLSILENAFKHGAGDDAGSPVIDICLSVKDDVFDFTVINSVSSVAGKAAGYNSEGIGLTNLRQQLQLIYGDAQQLLIGQYGTTFSVTLHINLNKRMP
jgi:sensor histidine kinase YesM